MKNNKKGKILNLKLIIFLVIVLIIARMTILLLGNGKISSLEGYLYSFAAAATGSDATSGNASSCDATSGNASSCDATSGNATSGNASNCDATSSNATSGNASNCDATSGNATSCNVPSSNPINSDTQNNKAQTTTKKENVVTNKETEIEQEETADEIESEVIEEDVENINTEVIEPTEKDKNMVAGEQKEVVSFLESHKTYVMIIGMCVLAIVFVTIIIIVDKRGIQKRKMQKQNVEVDEQPKAMKED